MTHQEIEEAIKIVNLKKELDEKDCSCHISPPCSKCVDTPTDDDIYEAVYTIIDLAKLHLSVMKSGVPKRLSDKAMTVEAPSVSAREFNRYWFLKKDGAVVALVPSKELAIELVQKCFDRNQAIDSFTAYFAQKLNGLEEVIRESGLCHLCLTEVWEAEKEIKELVETIRKHLEVER